MAYWNPIRGIGQPIPIRQFNGVFKPDDQGFNLPDNLFTELINFSPDKHPAITTRPGYKVIGTFGTSVLGLGAWKDTELHAVFSDGTWRKWDGSTWTQLASGLNTSAEWTFCNFRGNFPQINLIASNGVDPIKKYNGTTVSNLANAPAGGNYITTHSNRLYCAVENYLRFSALNKPEDWTTANDAGEIQVNTANGETINALSAGNGHVTVFKPSSMFELYGKGPQSYAMDEIASDIGATGNKAIIPYDNTLPFLSRDGIYRYSGGIRPDRDYSRPVQQFINGMNKAKSTKCVAGNDGKYLYFGIPLGTAEQNSRILQHDPLNNTWYTWDDIAVTQMLRIGHDMYFGDASGRVIKLGGDTDNGGKIKALAITKPFTAPEISRKQHWFKIWIVASISAGSSISVYISRYAAGEDWVLAKKLTSESGIQYQELLVPTNTVADANSVRLKIEAEGSVTIHEICYQLRQLPMRR